MQQTQLGEAASLRPAGIADAYRPGAWHSWDSPVGLGLALMSCGVAFALFGLALLFVRHAILG